MEKDKMSAESREEALERILAETARSPYRSGQYSKKTGTVKAPQKPAMPVVQEKKPVAVESLTNEEERIRAAEKIRQIKLARRQSADNGAEHVQHSEQQHSEYEKPQPQPVQIKRNKVRDIPEVPEIPNDDEIQEFEETEEYFENPKEKKSLLSDILSIAEYAVTAVFIVSLIFTYIVGVASVSGASMEPTLYTDDKLIILKAGYKPEKGDVVVVSDETANLISEDGKVVSKDGLDCKIVKRIIAMGGDTIDFDFEKGIVYVNGTALEEKYISEPTTRDEFAFEYPLTVPEGYVFVMGDNRNISKDSRHTDVGLVDEDEILGKVILRMYPFDNFGTVE